MMAMGKLGVLVTAALGLLTVAGRARSAESFVDPFDAINFSRFSFFPYYTLVPTGGNPGGHGVMNGNAGLFQAGVELVGDEAQGDYAAAGLPDDEFFADAFTSEADKARA